MRVARQAMRLGSLHAATSLNRMLRLTTCVAVDRAKYGRLIFAAIQTQTQFAIFSAHLLAIDKSQIKFRSMPDTKSIPRRQSSNGFRIIQMEDNWDRSYGKMHMGWIGSVVLHCRTSRTAAISTLSQIAILSQAVYNTGCRDCIIIIIINELNKVA